MFKRKRHPKEDKALNHMSKISPDPSAVNSKNGKEKAVTNR